MEEVKLGAFPFNNQKINKTGEDQGRFQNYEIEEETSRNRTRKRLRKIKQILKKNEAIELEVFTLPYQKMIGLTQTFRKLKDDNVKTKQKRRKSKKETKFRK